MKIQIILAGIGGQGILFASRVFSELGLKLGLDIMGSETHGMSQRGGSVIAHIKLGDFHSPLIREGTADILYSFEKNETYRTLKFLKRGGACFASIERKDAFDRKVLDRLKKKGISFRAFDADRAASEIGSILTSNIGLIGYSVGTGLAPFNYEDVKSVVKYLSQKKKQEINLTAFEKGFEEGKKLQSDSGTQL